MVEKIINNCLTSTKDFEDIYPFKSNFKKINGHELHYVDEGQGPPVLMVHGNPTWSFYFRNLIKDLSKDHRTIVPDHIGCGFSDKPDADSYDYTLQSRVNDLDSLIKGLDINQKISMIVHDWGGMIGLAWAIDNLERVDKIVITNTSGFFLPQDKKFPLRLKMIKYLRLFAIPAVLGFNVFARAALFMASSNKLPQKVKKGLVAPYNSWKNRIATLKFVQDIPITPKDKAYDLVHHVDSNLKNLKDSNLLFLWGAKDFVFDLTFYNEFTSRFPNALSRVFHDANHYLFEDKPDETLKMIRNFLDK